MTTWIHFDDIEKLNDRGTADGSTFEPFDFSDLSLLPHGRGAGACRAEVSGQGGRSNVFRRMTNHRRDGMKSSNVRPGAQPTTSRPLESE